MTPPQPTPGSCRSPALGQSSQPRQRASSVQMFITHVTHPPRDHPLASQNFDHSLSRSHDHLHRKKSSSAAVREYWEEASHGFYHDLKTMRWMRHPASSFRMLLIFLIPWLLFNLAQSLSWVSFNPFSPFILISYPLPPLPHERGLRYGKGTKDILFLAFYVIVFSFVRQAIIEYFIRPCALWFKLRGTKQQRFVDQGYGVCYWGSSTLMGLAVMSTQPTWWYNTSEFWKGYPHYRMEAPLKIFYLLQLSYWLQQMLVLSFKLEKPRSDYLELIIHHFVTLWLVGWSYITNLTMIGTAVFVSMDISDVFLGISKCINYTEYKHTSEFTFAIFVCVWTYFRHWQNLRILHSVYYEFDTLVPPAARRWSPSNEVYLVGWMKWQIFGPIFLLQLLNIFWYYLVWRIVFRLLAARPLTDVREEGETDDEDNDKSEQKKKSE